jgi:hypothetical protein
MDQMDYLSIHVKYGTPFLHESYVKVGIERALSVIIFLDKNIPDKYMADENNIRIISSIFNKSKNASYIEALQRRVRNDDPQKCVIEINESVKAREIIETLVTIDGEKMYYVLSPSDLINKILSKSIVDISYYKLFIELLSYKGHEFYFINPNLLEIHDDIFSLKFKELCLLFNNAILIGYSKKSSGGYEIRLNPPNEPFTKKDWLIFLAKNENSIKCGHTAESYNHVRPMEIKQPSETVFRKISVIGDRHDLKNILEFLDDQSGEIFRSNIYTMPNVEDYFDKEFIDKLIDKKFDHVIVNLKDDLAFRLTLYILSLESNEKDPERKLAYDMFASKLITLMENPIIEEISSDGVINKNTILSEKLGSMLIAQIAFQRNLSGVFNELLMKKGNEFHLLDINNPKYSRLFKLKKSELRYHLVMNNMIYIGIVDTQGKVIIDAENLQDAQKIIVIAEGEYR